MSLIRLAIAEVLLSFGALLAALSHICVSLAQRLSSASTRASWSKASRSFYNDPHRKSGMKAWELRLLAIGPLLITSIFSVLVVLWTLLLGGGLLVWLVVRGYGLPILIGTVILGVVIGWKRVRLKQHMPQHEQLN